MRNLQILAASALFLITACGRKPASGQLAWCSDKETDRKVESTLKRMTLDEKLGQMLQLELPKVGHTGFGGKFIVDDDKLDEIIGKYKVGSLLNTPQSPPPTPEEYWNLFLTPNPEIAKRYCAHCNRSVVRRQADS